MESKVAKLIMNFQNFINSGGDWVFISGVDSDMNLVISNSPIGTFNLYKYIEENFNIKLNFLTVEGFLSKYGTSIEEDDEAPTGYLNIEIQYALMNIENGKSIPFDTIEKSLGRSSARSDVVLQGVGISRVHCFIKLVGGKPCIKDNNSTNGVFINGSRVGNEYEVITDGSKVQIANSEFELKEV